jgi:hypothetical protein
VYTANKQDQPTDQDIPTLPGSLPSQSSGQVLKQRLTPEAQADAQREPKYEQQIEDDLSDEFMTLLVQRYTDLCHERQTLQEEIDDRLERNERLATEKLRCAIIHLDTIRERAIEVVAALNEASGGETRVRLPAGELDETHLETPIESVPKSANNFCSLPLNALPSPTPATDSARTAPVPDSTYSKNTAAATVIGTISCPSPSTPHGATIDRLAELIQELRGKPAMPPPPLPPQKPRSSVTATQQAIFKRYDELIKAVKAVGTAVPTSPVPWPLLVPHAHQYPMRNVMEKDLVHSDVVGFIDLYSRWKGWNLSKDGQPMRKDWEKLLSMIPEHKRGERACAAKVVSILRELVPDRSGN